MGLKKTPLEEVRGHERLGVEGEYREDTWQWFGRSMKNMKWVKLGGGFKYFLFSPLPGEMIQFD